MSYLRLLEEAHHQLERGELLAAEDLLRRAREAWTRSRFRAPVVERGLEPVLRRAGKWLGRRSSSPVLPVFGHRAARLEEDLASLARLLRDEALDLARQQGESQGQHELELLERALRLDRQSAVFVLDGPQRWAVARSYLQVGRRLARAPRSDLVPTEVAAASDLDWLGEWAEAWLGGGALGDVMMLDWVVRQASAAASLASSDPRDASRWWWIAARASLRDPLDGPRALIATRRAVDAGGLDADAHEQALRALAGLLINERVLAGPGADARAVLRRHLPLARGREWPGSEVEELLNARVPPVDRPALVSLAWSAPGTDLVLVAHQCARACDALALRIAETSTGLDPFTATVAEARGWIHRWLPARAVLVLAELPPATIQSVLGDAPRLRVDLLRTALTEADAACEPASPAVSHPLWSAGPVPEPWAELAAAARRLVPALATTLTDAPAFGSGWGRANLRALAEYGLSLCGALDLAAEALIGTSQSVDEDLQTVTVGVELRWPRLQERAWRTVAPSALQSGAGATEVEAPPALEAGSDGWVGRRATTAELAAIAVAHRRSEILTATAVRAVSIAAEVAARIDARRVTVAPSRERCAEPWLALLEQWIAEAVADPQRQLDVLWLLRALSETATGDPAAHLGNVRPAATLAAVDAVAARDHRCGPDCRMASVEGCWHVQLASRREQAAVWIVDLERSTDSIDSPACVLLDDPRTWVVQAATADAEARLEHGLRRVRAAERAWMWMNAGVLTDAILEAWRRRLVRPRPLHRRPAPGLRPPAELWTAPPGYRPADPLLAREAEQLLELRAEILRRAPGDAVWWHGSVTTAESPGVRTVTGVAMQALAPEVVCTWLGDAAPHSDLLLLLRAGAALSHASVRAIVLDPRLAHLLGHAGGAWTEGVTAPLPDALLDEALLPGARLLGGRNAHAGPRWSHPIDRERMLTVQRQNPMGPAVDDTRLEALARALRESARGHSVVLAALTDTARRLVIDTARAMAEASGDGGPWGVRCVVVVGAPESWRVHDARARVLDDANDRSLGTVVLEVERGSVTRIDLHPSLLDDDGVLAWAGRASSLAWFFARGERDFDADPLSHLVDPDALRRGPARARRWAAAIGRAASRSIAFVDGRSIESEQMARALDARVVDLEGAPSPSEWGVESHVVSAVEIACPHCEATMTVDDLFAICPACDRRASTRALGRARVWSAVEDALVHRLRREAAQRTWWAVTSRSERVHQLRDRLGLQPWEQGEAPLLTGSEHAEVGPSTGVWSAAELWAQRGPAPEVFLIGLARDLGQLRALLARLDALEAGSRKIELLLGPIGFEASTAAPLRGERGRWTVARTEVEFRLRSRLRARATESALQRAGLGPANSIPQFEDESSEVLDALLGATRSLEAVERAVSDALGALERAGLGFGAAIARSLPDSLARAHAGVLRWAIAEGLLEPEREALEEHEDELAGTDALHARQWERALRGSMPAGGDRIGQLPEYRVQRRDPQVAPERAGSARRLGIAGSGKTTWLRGQVERARAAGQRVLVIVPTAGARAAWSRVGTHRMDVVVPDEVALAFLRSPSAGSGDGALRLLPPAGRGDGEEVRLRLMRETSRRYASVVGTVPSIDAADLRRSVEDDRAELLSAASGGLDPSLLARCAEEARAAAGWLTTRQLRERCRRWFERERVDENDWSARYPCIAVDDAQDVHPDLLAFLRELFQGSQWYETADPLLGAVPPLREHTREVEVDLQSRSMPREWITAIEVLWRGAPALPGRPRTSRKDRDGRRLQSVRVLTLEAAHDWIVTEVDGDRPADRTAVIVAHENDRAWLAQALHASGRRVRIAERWGRWSASGPRELLACLHLVHDTTEEDRARERLLACVLGAAFEASEGSAMDLLTDFDVARRAGGDAPAVLDVESARVRVLASLAAALRTVPALGEALEVVLRRGVLDPLLTCDAAVGRLRDLLEQESTRPVRDLLGSVPADFVAEPQGPSRALWLLGPDDLPVATFDHVLHVCTGYEPPSRHYRVLAAAAERFTLLHSERDPLR